MKRRIFSGRRDGSREKIPMEEEEAWSGRMTEGECLLKT
jgi:hypothetical protein